MIQKLSKIVSPKNLFGRRYASLVAELLFSNISYVPVALNAMSALKKDDQTQYNQNIAIDDEKEWNDILGRAEYLCQNVICNPSILINKMPKIIGRQYQGQWAIYACSMTAVSLCNIIRIKHKMGIHYLPKVKSLIEMVLSTEIRYYDTMEWHEDALETLAGDKSHMTYLSILAWMISNYRLSGGDNQYDSLYFDLCQTLARRMRNSKDLNLPSFPNGIVFLPDMMFSLIALKNFGKIYDDRYNVLISDWINNAKTLWRDKRTGLLISQYYPNGRRSPLHGSYAALNCACLTMLDEIFAAEQYILLKNHFGRFGKYCGIKEYLHKSPELGFHIDAGPIIMGLSPTGTSFALGPATFFGDWGFRFGLLNMAELAGKTIIKGNTRHYKLADILLTGEAITLCMRTNFRH